MKQTNTTLWVHTALFAAMATISTMVLTIPTPTGGYVNLGDVAVLMSAYFLGPWYGALAAGVGSALADLLLGYAIYAPATLLIKGLMAVVAGFLCKSLGMSVQGRITCAVCAELVMITGYFLFDGILSGSLLVALPGIGGNLVQATFAIVASTALALSLSKTNLVGKFAK